MRKTTLTILPGMMQFQTPNVGKTGFNVIFPMNGLTKCVETNHQKY